MIVNQLINSQVHVKRRNKFLSMLFLYVVYVWAIIHTYDFQIAEENAYAGMQPWEITSFGWVILAMALLLIAFIVSRIKGSPSDLFVVFYSAIPVISFFALTSTSGKINNSILLPSLLVVIFPLFSILVFRHLVPKIKWSGVVPSIIIERILLGILFLVIIFSYINPPASAGFDIITSYDRRLEGREIYTAGSLIAYALAMCMNGFAPYLAFRGAVSGRKLLSTAALGAVIFFYWLLGVKAPIVFVLLAYLLGLLIKKDKLSSFAKYFLCGIIGMYVLVQVEWWLFDNYSIIADYGFRRLFPVQAEVQGYYFDSLMVDTPSAWNWLIGASDQTFQATYYIGEKYMGNLDSNVNTNAFLYAFLTNGLLGYIFAVFFVSVFLIVVDRLYRSTQNPIYLLIGFIYGVLVTEQAFTTAMVSSGVGLLFLLTLFEKYDPSIADGYRTNKTKINRGVML